MHTTPENPTGGSEETWLHAALDEMSEPNLMPEEGAPQIDPALQLTKEDFESAEKIKFNSLSRANLLVGMGEMAVWWEGQGMYRDSLVVRQKAGEDADEAFLFIGGSVFIPTTRDEMLTEDEVKLLPHYSWKQQGLTYSTTSESTPFIVAPGTLCREAHLYYRPALALHETRTPRSINATLHEPENGSLISIEKAPGRTMTLFVMARALYTQPITELLRRDGHSFFPLFEQSA